MLWQMQESTLPQILYVPIANIKKKSVFWLAQMMLHVMT